MEIEGCGIPHATDRPRGGDPLLHARPGRLPDRSRPGHRHPARHSRQKAPGRPPRMSWWPKWHCLDGMTIAHAGYAAGALAPAAMARPARPRLHRTAPCRPQGSRRLHRGLGRAPHGNQRKAETPRPKAAIDPLPTRRIAGLKGSLWPAARWLTTPVRLAERAPDLLICAAARPPKLTRAAAPNGGSSATVVTSDVTRRNRSSGKRATLSPSRC